jgi:hypothetical protein
LQEKETAKQRSDPHTRLRVPTGTARVLYASAPPPPGGGGGGGRDWREFRGGSRRRGSPLGLTECRHPEMNRGAAACAGHPAGGAAARAAVAAEVPRLGGGAPGSRRWPESLGLRGGARRGSERRELEERAKRRSRSAGGRAAGEGGCVWSRCALRAEARAASRSRATSKPGARLCRLPPRLFCLLCSCLALPFCVSRVAHQYGLRREALRGGSIRPPAYPSKALAWLSRSSAGASARDLFLVSRFAFARRRVSYHLRLAVIT